MKTRTFLLSLVAFAAAACAQTPEERIKAYEEKHEAMLTEYRTMMDSLSSDQAAAEAYYNDFVEKYIEFNLEAAKKNSDNEVAVQVLMNLVDLFQTSSRQRFLMRCLLNCLKTSR